MPEGSLPRNALSPSPRQRHMSYFGCLKASLNLLGKECIAMFAAMASKAATLLLLLCTLAFQALNVLSQPPRPENRPAAPTLTPAPAWANSQTLAPTVRRLTVVSEHSDAVRPSTGAHPMGSRLPAASEHEQETYTKADPASAPDAAPLPAPTATTAAAAQPGSSAAASEVACVSATSIPRSPARLAAWVSPALDDAFAECHQLSQNATCDFLAVEVSQNITGYVALAWEDYIAFTRQIPQGCKGLALLSDVASAFTAAVSQVLTSAADRAGCGSPDPDVAVIIDQALDSGLSQQACMADYQQATVTSPDGSACHAAIMKGVQPTLATALARALAKC